MARLALHQVPEALRQQTTEHVRQKLMTLLRDLVDSTPRQSGLTAASWGLSLRGETPKVLEPEAFAEPAAAQNQMETQLAAWEAQLAGATLEDLRTVKIYNSSPHIEALEDGSSQQAPGGFIAAALARLSS